MGGYIYTVTDRATGKLLFKCSSGACAAFLGTGKAYLSNLAGEEVRPEKRRRYGRYYITRHWEEKVNPKVDTGVDKPCEGCGVLMKGVSKRRRFCRSCAGARGAEQKRKAREARRIPKTSADIQKACAGCAYLGGENNVNRSCNYIFIEGRSRGCPPGEGCTRKKIGKSIRVMFG